MVRLDALHYLQEVASAGSINKAADKLFLSKSSLSTAIKNLEQELEIPLLERTIQGVHLTPAGEKVVEKANLIFSIMDEMEKECKKLKFLEQKRVDIYVTQQFANTFFSDILVELKRCIPNAYFAVHCVEYEIMFEQIKNNPYSIGIIQKMARIDENIPLGEKKLYNDCIIKHVSTHNVCVATAKFSKYIPPHVTSISTDDLKKIPQIELFTYHSYHDDLDEKLNEFLRYEDRKNNKYVMTTDNNVVYFQAIANDIGVGKVLDINSSIGKQNRSQLRIMPLSDAEEKAELWTVFPKDAEEREINYLSEIIGNIIR